MVTPAHMTTREDRAQGTDSPKSQMAKTISFRQREAPRGASG